MAVSHGIKAAAILSAIFGLIALVVSCWTFGSIIVYHSHFEMTFGKSKVVLSTQDDVSSALHAPPYQYPYSKKSKVVLSTQEDVSSALPASPYQYPYSKHHNSKTISSLWAKLYDMSEYFKTLMICCTWVVNLAVLVQVTVAVTVFFRIKKKISKGAKYLVGSHFIVFVILLICFFVPLTEDRQTNTHHTVTTFNDVIMSEFETLNDMGIQYVWQDVHAYYFAVAFNIAVLFIAMITACCLLRFDTQQYESVS